MAIVSTITTVYELDTSALTRGAKTATDAVKKSSSRIAKSVGTISKQFSIASGVAVVALAAIATSMIKTGLTTIDSTAKMADKIGITTEKLIGLQKAAEFAGSTADTMNASLEKAVKRLGEAATGGGSAAKTIDQLGLNITDLQSLSPDELFNSYADAIGNMNTRGEQLAAISSLMGDESRSLIGVIDGGVDSINAITAEVVGYGAALSRVDAAKIEIANDSLSRVSNAMEGIGTQLTIAVAPFLSALATGIADAATETGGFKDQMQGAFEGVVFVVGSVIDSFRQLRLGILLTKEELLGSLVAYEEFREMVIPDFMRADIDIANLKAFKNSLNETRVSLQELNNVMLNGSAVESMRAGLKKLTDEANANAAVVAAAAAARAEASKGGGEDDGGSGGVDNSKALQTNIDNIRNSFKTASELESDNLNERLSQVNEFYANIVGITEEQEAEKRALIEQIEVEHGSKMFDIHQDLNDQKAISDEALAAKQEQLRDTQIRGTAQLSREIVAITKGQSGALGAIGKAAAVTGTIASGVSAGIAALAPPPVGLGPVFGPAVATAVGIKTTMAVAKIAGLQKGGGINPHQTALVGENGPELITMGAQGGFVNTASTTERLLNTDNSKSINITSNVIFEIQAYDAEDTANWIDKNKDTIAAGVEESLRENLKEL